MTPFRTILDKYSTRYDHLNQGRYSGIKVQWAVQLPFCTFCFLVPFLLLVSLLLMYFACILAHLRVSHMYQPFIIVNIIYEKAEYYSFH